MRPKPRVSFADRPPSEENLSVTSEAIKKMRQSLSNILCFRAIDSRDGDRRSRVTRTQEVYDLIGSKVNLKLKATKSKHRHQTCGSTSNIRLNVNKPLYSRHVRDDNYENLSDFVSITTTPDETSTPIVSTSSSTTPTNKQHGRHHDLRPARTYCDIYRNSMDKVRTGFSQMSQRNPHQTRSSHVIQANHIQMSEVKDEHPEVKENDLNLKRSVHIYEFTEEQVQKIRKKGCIKLNVKVKPDMCINDLDLIIDRNQVVAIASTSSAPERRYS